MPHISSPVFSDSLSGWAIEKTKTLNDSLSTGKRHLLTLAVTLVVLPIFAVLDVAIYLVPSMVALVTKNPALLLKQVWTILFIVQLPFLMLANLCGANLLPKVSHSDERWSSFGNSIEIEKFKLALNQYKHNECSFEEFIESKKHLNSPAHYPDYLVRELLKEPFSLNKHLLSCSGIQIKDKLLVDRVLGKQNTTKLLPEVAMQAHQALEKTYCELINAANWGITRRDGLAFDYEEEVQKTLQTAMALMEHIDQPFSPKTKDLLIVNLPQMHERVPHELKKGILNYVKRTGDIESWNEIMVSLQERIVSPDEPQENFPGLLSTLSELLNEHAAKRVIGIVKHTPLTPPGLAELIESYGVSQNKN